MPQEETPSDILNRISSKATDSILRNALEKNLYPVLDQLSPKPRSQIIRSLRIAERDAEAAAELLELINYDVHEKSLNEQVKALERDCQQDWHDGYDKQAEMMMKISKEVLRWLPNLWQVGIERGLEIQSVQKCLILCTTIIKQVARCRSRTEFGELDFSITIYNTDGNVVYEDRRYILQSIAWVWKELLVSVISKNGSSDDILANINRLELKDKIYDYLQKGDEETRPDGRNYWDAHWSEDMKAVAIALLDERHQDRIKAFERHFNFTLYQQILSEDPTLKDHLLQVTRKQMFQDKRLMVSSDYQKAAEIFKAESPDDLLNLYDALPGHMNTAETKKIIFNAFAESDVPALRAKALELIESGLKGAKRRVNDEVEIVFPYFGDAYDWLEMMIDDGKFTIKAPGDRKNRDPAIRNAIARREKMLEKFVEKAIGDPEREWEDPMDGYNSDDSGYRNRKQRAAPDLKEGILYWLEVLGNWKSREEAERV
ncbi:hypothetical protein QCA50_020383 [Cerrena zonata]|uniref:Zorya protein ZorC EH domain-containing protein n=1 Tax=Cerrena zonata TaxID=2478898 RepID=A0AAW0FCN6_9APHY